MATLITDPALEEEIRARRAEWGADRFDEVWDGTCLITPPRNIEHADIQAGVATAIRFALGFSSPAKAFFSVTVSDRLDDWEENYRRPDVAVVLPGSIAKDCGAYCLGGPDFIVEIVSPDDQSREKITFYERVGVREMLIIDRDPWRLELYRLQDGRLELVGQSEVGRSDILRSSVLPLSFQLIAGQPRPRIDVRHNDGVQQWLA